jgi:hypothetical protein
MREVDWRPKKKLRVNSGESFRDLLVDSAVVDGKQPFVRHSRGRFSGCEPCSRALRSES